MKKYTEIMITYILQFTWKLRYIFKINTVVNHGHDYRD